QAILEEAYFRLLNPLYRKTRQKAVCLAGGVAFNCVANGKIFDRTPFTDVYVQPAAGDAGLAVGAAYYVYHQVLGQPRKFVMEHACWGPQYDSNRIRRALEGSRGASSGLPHTERPGDEVASQPADQSTLLVAHKGIREVDRCARATEHFLQRERADRSDA